jgi:ribosomal protein S15P/S13E
MTTDASHRQFLTAQRDAERAAAEAALHIADALWDELQALNERIANGVVHIGNHPDDRRAKALLAELRRQRRDLLARHDDAAAEFRRLDEIYLMSVRGLRFHGVYEEDPTTGTGEE